MASKKHALASQGPSSQDYTMTCMACISCLTEGGVHAWAPTNATCELQNKVLEQLEEDIHSGRDFTLQARRREAGLDGAAAARDSTFEITFRFQSCQIEKQISDFVPKDMLFIMYAILVGQRHTAMHE